jgi:hypothetical protein
MADKKTLIPILEEESLTTKNELITILKNLTTLQKIPQLQEAVNYLEKPHVNISENKSAITILVFVYLLIKSHPEALSDPNIKSLDAFCQKRIKKEFSDVLELLGNPTILSMKKTSLATALDLLTLITMLESYPDEPKNIHTTTRNPIFKS